MSEVPLYTKKGPLLLPKWPDTMYCTVGTSGGAVSYARVRDPALEGR
jgi:hypothetical protein